MECRAACSQVSCGPFCGPWGTWGSLTGIGKAPQSLQGLTFKVVGVVGLEPTTR